jgi:hypothetical protein
MTPSDRATLASRAAFPIGLREALTGAVEPADGARELVFPRGLTARAGVARLLPGLGRCGPLERIVELVPEGLVELAPVRDERAVRAGAAPFESEAPGSGGKSGGTRPTAVVT